MNNKLKYFISVIMIVIIFLTLIRIYNSYVEINNLEVEINNLRTEIEQAKEQKTVLKKQLNNIEDEKYIEKMAREKLGLVKPGEMLLVPVEREQEESGN